VHAVRQQLNLKVMQIFDLKGSTRNRHVKSTGRENEVLLDENLVECKFKSNFMISFLNIVQPQVITPFISVNTQNVSCVAPYTMIANSLQISTLWIIP
jgi:hypothetical protein